MDPDASTHMDHMTEDAPTASPEASIDMEMETDLETATFPPQPSSSPPLLPPMGAIGYVELEYGQNQHSLPNLEEARTEGAIAQGGSYNRYSGKNKRFAALVAIAVTTIALVVGFSVAFVQTHKGNSAASSSSINSSPPADPQDPSVATTRNVSRLEEVQAFLSVSITKDFANLTSPQYRALLWIADQDEAMVSVPQDPANYETSYAFVQRYVLAVFYFALDGPNWMHKMGFLSKQSECDWNFGLSATVPGFAQASFMYGVHCNARNAISSIFISTLICFLNMVPRYCACLPYAEVY